MKKINMKDKVCIIGAGPAGLAAAHELSRKNIPAVVIEALSVPGGISRTEVHESYRADLGGHRFFTQNQMLNELWQDILGEDFLLRPRLSRILYQNKFFDYPLRIKNVLVNIGVLEASLCLLSYMKSRMFPAKEINTFQDWVTERFGARLFNTFFKTYTEKVWGIPCSAISADWAAQRIRNLSLREAVKNALLAQAGIGNKKLIASLIEQFHYPRLGPGMMWEALAARIREQNGSVEYDSRVVSIKHKNNEVFSIKLQRGSEEENLKVSSCISSMPLSELIFSLNPAPPEEILEAARKLAYRDYIAVNLIIDAPDLFPDNWIYVHDPCVELGRIQNYKNWSPDMVPVEGKTVLGLEYFHFERDPEWSWPDSWLIERGKKELSRLGLIDKANVEGGWVTRVPKAYPVYDNNYKDSLALIQEYLASFKNLQTIGRNGTHRYNNMDHSMLSGIFAASNILGKKRNLWDINTEEEYHEETDASLEEAVELITNEIDPVAAGAGAAAALSFFTFFLTLVTLYFADEAVVNIISLLGNYFFGYSVSWVGAVIIMLESCLAGFLSGSIIAWLRNVVLRILIT
jgi:protoporphyrinogen oxidase